MIINPAVPPLDEGRESTDAQPEVEEVDVEVARAFAGKMNAAEDRWFVMYGAGSRSYWAFPLWDPGTSLVLEDPSPQRLLVAMREAEARHARAR